MSEYASIMKTANAPRALSTINTKTGKKQTTTVSSRSIRLQGKGENGADLMSSVSVDRFVEDLAALKYGKEIGELITKLAKEAFDLYGNKTSYYVRDRLLQYIIDSAFLTDYKLTSPLYVTIQCPYTKDGMKKWALFNIPPVLLHALRQLYGEEHINHIRRRYREVRERPTMSNHSYEVRYKLTMDVLDIDLIIELEQHDELKPQ